MAKHLTHFILHENLWKCINFIFFQAALKKIKSRFCHLKKKKKKLVVQFFPHINSSEWSCFIQKSKYVKKLRKVAIITIKIHEGIKQSILLICIIFFSSCMCIIFHKGSSKKENVTQLLEAQYQYHNYIACLSYPYKKI